jgi:hypothetical protein
VIVEGGKLDDLIHHKRLFLLDYKALAPYQFPRQHRGMHFHAPQVILYATTDGKVLPAAIHFTDGDKLHRVVTPQDGTPNAWIFAKMHAMCADMQLYSFLYHLGSAHMCSEPFVVGIHNVFTIRDEGQHFMSKLMRPHFKNLLGINHFGSISLVSDVAPLTDQTFSIGTRGGMTAFAEYYNNGYNFLNMAPDNDLKERGFALDPTSDAFPYYYREDALRLFNVILEYTTKVL